MPERDWSGYHHWHRLGALLPPTVRTRVYEPALTDLWIRHAIAPAAPPRHSFGLEALGTLVGCLPLSLADLWRRRRRLPMAGRVAVAAVAVVVLIRLVAARWVTYP